MRSMYLVPEAIHLMVLHPGTPQERLAHGMHHLVSIISENDLPKELRTAFETIVATATRVDPEASHISRHRGQGKIVATCMCMTTQEAVSVIQAIVDLDLSLDEHRRSADGGRVNDA